MSLKIRLSRGGAKKRAFYRIVVADEGHLRGGAAADIASMVAEKGFDSLDAPVKRVASLDVPIPFSPPLERAAVADEARIERAIRELLGN